VQFNDLPGIVLCKINGRDNELDSLWMGEDDEPLLKLFPAIANDSAAAAGSGAAGDAKSKPTAAADSKAKSGAAASAASAAAGAAAAVAGPGARAAAGVVYRQSSFTTRAILSFLHARVPALRAWMDLPLAQARLAALRAVRLEALTAALDRSAAIMLECKQTPSLMVALHVFEQLSLPPKELAHWKRTLTTNLKVKEARHSTHTRARMHMRTRHSPPVSSLRPCL
jgi:hypothetical protein